MESPPPLPAESSVRRSSLGARLLNIFVTPADVFAEVKESPPSTANWLLPAIFSCVLVIAFSLLVFSQDAILHQMREQQENAMEKRLQKMPKEQREKAKEMASYFTQPALLMVSTAVVGIISIFGWLFLVGLFIWLLGTKILKGRFEYMKAIEICGLASMVSVLGGIVNTLLVLVTGRLEMTLSPALLVRDFDPANLSHLMLASLNVMTIWLCVVLGIGVAKMSGASTAKAVTWMLSCWAVITSAFMGLGWAARHAWS